MTARRRPPRRPRTRPNEARAARPDAPAHLTPGHWQEAPVQSALATIGAFEAHPAPELGRGNFGIGYPVRLRDGTPAILKVAATESIHGRPWTRAEQEANLMHEAGVANELRALGFRVVPDTVYARLADGTPALLREYGHPTGPVSIQEAAALEAQLVAIETLGWRVEDELLVYRRDDDSLYVADVGLWQTPRVRDRWNTSTLYHLVRAFAPDLPSLALATLNAERLGRMMDNADEEIAEGEPPPKGWAKWHEPELLKLESWQRDRLALGLDAPIDVAAMRRRFDRIAAACV